MKKFTCTRLRLCGYLMDRGFMPIQTFPDRHNPLYTVWVFEETPELSAAVVQYLSTDCWTARNSTKEGQINHGAKNIKNERT